MYALCSNTHWHGTCCDDAPGSLHDFQLIHSLTHLLACQCQWATPRPSCSRASGSQPERSAVLGYSIWAETEVKYTSISRFVAFCSFELMTPGFLFLCDARDSEILRSCFVMVSPACRDSYWTVRSEYSTTECMYVCTIGYVDSGFISGSVYQWTQIRWRD